MLSLDNVFSPEEFTAWTASLARRLGHEAERFGVEPKLDGLAVAARYTGGKLKQADHPRGRDGRGGRLARDRHHRGAARRTRRTGHRGGPGRSPHDHRPVRARQRGAHRARRTALRQPARRRRGQPACQGACLHRADDLLRLRPAAPARHRHGARRPADGPRAQRTDGTGRRVRHQHHRHDRRPRQHRHHRRAGTGPGAGDRRPARRTAVRDRRHRHQGRPRRRPARRGRGLTRPRWAIAYKL